MKRIWLVLGIYTVIVFGLCVGASFIYGGLPVLVPRAVGGYKFVRSILWFLNLLPAILISGFVVGCCVQWKNGTYNSRERFSAAMMDRYKAVFIIGLVIMAVLTICQEIFVPQLQKKQKVAETNPAELQKDISLAEYYLNQRQATLAWHYAEQAYKIDPSNEDALYIYRTTHDAMEITLNEFEKENEAVVATLPQKIQGPIEIEEQGYTVKELIDKSLAAAEEKRWFDSHYWASLAQKICPQTELNYSRAVELANAAWNNMSSPKDFENEEERAYYAKKREGYTALNSGDFLRSYYLFQELSLSSPEHAQDPDVIRYYERSKEKLENQYFFIDETEDMHNLVNASDVYFCLKMNDGSMDVIYIDKMASLKTAGGLVRYVDGLTVVRYGKTGSFLYKMYVPYAKIVAAPVSVFDEATKNALGIPKKWKNIPQIYLQSVDRRTEGRISRPEYYMNVDGLPDSIQNSLGMTQIQFPGNPGIRVKDIASGALQFAENSLLFLPMPFEDLDSLTAVSSGYNSMNLMTLNKFLSKADFYGFPSDIYIQSLVCRGTYPLLVLIMVIFAAVVAWNYRFVDENSVFKFRWIFLLPILFAIIFMMYNCIVYLCQMINFVFVGMFGGLALLMAFIFYVVVLLVVSLFFLARRSDA